MRLWSLRCRLLTVLWGACVSTPHAPQGFSVVSKQVIPRLPFSQFGNKLTAFPRERNRAALTLL